MASPANVHVDAALTNISVAYTSNEYISNRVYPSVTVKMQSDKYYKIDEEREGIRQQDDRRAPGAEAQEADMEMTTDNYFAEDHALRGIVTDEERRNADPAVTADIEKTELLTGKILLNKEIVLVAQLATATANDGTDLTNITDEWDDYASGDPVGDIKKGTTRLISNSSGKIPNTMILPYSVFLAVKDHPDIIDRCKHISSPANPAVATAQTLAQIFGIDEVLIPRCFKNTAAKDATPVIVEVWGENNVMLMFKAPRPGLHTQTAGYTFEWSGSSGVSRNGMLVKTWRENSRGGEMVQVDYYYDQKNVDTDCLYRFANTLTS